MFSISSIKHSLFQSNKEKLASNVFKRFKRNQIKVFNKDLRPTLCVNEVEEEKVDIKTIRNVIINYGLHPENVERWTGKMEIQPLWWFSNLKIKVKNDEPKKYYIRLLTNTKQTRKYVNKDKLIIRYFKCNKFEYLSNSSKNDKSFCSKFECSKYGTKKSKRKLPKAK